MIRFRTWLRETRTPLHIAFARPWPTTRRGLALWLLSLAFIIIGGVNYIATDLPAQNRESLAFALTIAPAPVWGWVMVVLGVFTAYCSYCHLGRDRVGFTLLASFCGVWAVGYICGLWFFDAPLRALGGSVIWFVFCALLVVIAGFPSVPLHRSDIAAPVCRPDGDS